MSGPLQDNPTPSATPNVSMPASPAAAPCGFTLPTLPKFNFGFKLPSIAFPPKIPLPFIAFKISCDPTKPVDVTAGLKLPFGGGRVNNAPPDPDNEDGGNT